MTPAEILLYSNSILSVLAVAGHLKGWLNSGEKQLKEDVSAHTGKLTDHDRRIQSMENEIKHLPDRDAQHRMELAIEKMAGQFATMEEKLKPIAATSQRLHDLLMEQAKK